MKSGIPQYNVFFHRLFLRRKVRICFMATKTAVKSKAPTKKTDPLWEDIKAGFESIKRGKITEWKYPFK